MRSKLELRALLIEVEKKFVEAFGEKPPGGFIEAYVHSQWYKAAEKFLHDRLSHLPPADWQTFTQIFSEPAPAPQPPPAPKQTPTVVEFSRGNTKPGRKKQKKS